jgi:hypothetical protein
LGFQQRRIDALLIAPVHEEYPPDRWMCACIGGCLRPEEGLEGDYRSKREEIATLHHFEAPGVGGCSY